jgi:hypothetical protein
MNSKRLVRTVVGGLAVVGLLIGSTSVAFAAKGPKAKASPHSKLANGTVVTITGSKWPASDEASGSIAILQCSTATPTSSDYTTVCNFSGVEETQANSSGDFSTPFTVALGYGSPAQCGYGATCYIQVADIASAGAIKAKPIKIKMEKAPKT